jgi:murein DD-endopeptidase MepM/ murein hydrolase activator NlpD
VKHFLLAAALALLPLCAYAADSLRIAGPEDQGGLVIGSAAPGAHVVVNGAAIPVASSGAFAIGLARDAGSTLVIEARFPDGKSLRRTLAIAKHPWPVQRINGLPEREVTPPASDIAAIKDEQRKIAEARSHRRDDDSFARGFIWPAHGPISGPFGAQRILNGQPRAAHLGLDIAAKEGAAIHAAADGVVVLAAPGLFFNGNVVVLDHGLGVTTVYAHMAKIEVREGETVHQGDVLGTVGRTGRATGPHVHFGINVRGVGVDPAQVLPPPEGPNNTLGAVNTGN